MAKTIIHRGWNGDNSHLGILKALDNGYGVEFDVRDVGGKLYITHDPFLREAQMEQAQELSQLFDSIHFMDPGPLKDPEWGPLAINIKSAGLGPALKKMIDGFKIRNYFFFDLPGPDMVEYHDLGLKYAQRVSDREINVLTTPPPIVVIDEYQSQHYTEFMKEARAFSQDLKIMAVCPSLRGRVSDYPEDLVDYWLRKTPS